MKKIIKQEQWVMLPTDESPISLNNNGNLYFIGTMKEDYIKSEHHQPQHLYLISDEEKKEGDWCYDSYNNELFQWNGSPFEVTIKSCKKIIATTDKSLQTIGLANGKIYSHEAKGTKFEDKGLPQIPESFIKYYVEKQGEVGDVELELEKDNYYYNARVIIPKEEEKMYSRDEVEKIATQSYMRGMSVQVGQIKPKTSFNKWLKELINNL